MTTPLTAPPSRRPVIRLLRAVPAPLWAWLAMMALTGLSVLAAGESHHGVSRVLMTSAVAFLAWVKGLLLIRYYLEARHAGPLFHRLMLVFAMLAPAALIVSALHEA